MVPDTLKKRIAVGVLTLSAAGFVGLVSQEGFTDHAVIPVKGDVPTYGFGMTHRPDGTPVQLGDTTTPQKAMRQSLDHLNAEQSEIKQCVHADLTQAEYDQMVDFGYQYGTRALCNSSIVTYANVGAYAQSCEAYLQYRFVGKGKDRYDCSTLVDGQPNKRCYGVWTRSKLRRDACMAAQ